VVLGGVLLTAQTLDRAAVDARLGRIFQDGAYEPPAFGPARWMADGAAYSTVEPSGAAGGTDLVRYDAASGARSVLVPSARLIPTGRTTPLAIRDYAWSADGARLLVFTNTTRVWRQHTRGDYWVLDLASGRLRQLGGDAPPSSLMFAKFSPDGTRVAWVRANNLYVETIDTGAIAATTSGSATTINGTSDWVYEEELGVRDGFRWSLMASAGLLAVRHERRRHLLAHQQHRFDLSGRYGHSVPEAGHRQQRRAHRRRRRDRRRHHVDGDSRRSARRLPRPARVARCRHGRDPAAQPPAEPAGPADGGRHDRCRHPRVPRIAPRRGSTSWTRCAGSTAAPASCGRVNATAGVTCIAAKDAATTPVTRFDADILAMAGTDADDTWVYFTASPTDATASYLYRARVDGTGTPERVTPADQRGTHTYRLAPGGRLAFHTWSRFEMPPVTDVVELPSHRVLRTPPTRPPCAPRSRRSSRGRSSSSPWTSAAA
jgi:dipeptidyl-peptidase-4